MKTNATIADLAAAIDHTKLTFGSGEGSPKTRETAIIRLCEEAKAYGFKAVCVRPPFVALAKKTLETAEQPPVLVATVIGFPGHKAALADELAYPTFGSVPIERKLEETRKALADGADEIDLVMDVAQFKLDFKHLQTDTHAPSATKSDFCRMRDVCGRIPIKVIIETDLLSETEIVQASHWCAETQMAMVKTSTGMLESGKGATLESIALIRKTLLGHAGQHPQTPTLAIKASGGVKTRAGAEALLAAGASRIGTSAGLAILAETAPV